ncbi:MAG TPA: hypothetical protein VGD43_22975, partial [Micromonospora sp.]
MTWKRVVLGVAAAGFAVALFVGCLGGIVSDVFTGDRIAEGQRCVEELAAEATTVHTERWKPDRDLPGVGSYPEIHWQVRSLGNPCSRVPGPTDRTYQGLIRLQPADARALDERYAFTSRPGDPDDLSDFAMPADVWPALAPLLPQTGRWYYSPSYNEAASV